MANYYFLVITHKGSFLLIQFIYQGTTTRCLPSYQFPSDLDIGYTAYHWCNEQTMVRKQFSHICTVRKLAKGYFSLLIYSIRTLNGQWTEDILNLLDPKNINVAIIPANFTATRSEHQ